MKLKFDKRLAIGFIVIMIFLSLYVVYAIVKNDLPSNYFECILKGGYTVESTCTFTIGDKENPELFSKCEEAGGGLVANGGTYCKVLYPILGTPCFGNLCD